MPFKTIRQAQQAVRDILAEGQTGNITVYLDVGDYRITEPFKFGTEDSGQGDHSITFKYCSWLLPEKGYAGIQACYHDPRPASDHWAAVPSSIEVRWDENCSFTDCHLKHLGRSGLRIGMGYTGCSVT